MDLDDLRPSSVNDIVLDEVNDTELKKLSEYFEKSRAEIQKVT
jgi:preprotein translocase subunit SecE